MSEREKSPISIRGLMLKLTPMVGREWTDLERVISDAEAHKGLGIEQFVRYSSGEADIMLARISRVGDREDRETIFYSLRRVDGHLRTVSIIKFSDNSPMQKAEFLYREGQLVGKDYSEDDELIYSDRYVKNVFRLTVPPILIPVFDIERTYTEKASKENGKTQDHIKFEDILTNYYPFSWVWEDFKALVSDVFLPTGTDIKAAFDAKTDVAVKEEDLIERFVDFPTLPPGRKIRATLRVEKWDLGNFVAQLELISTELVDA